jgi:serine-type D-Ala-D-Ala carboxypeptidase (penicillin-binding protein 5/6)
VRLIPRRKSARITAAAVAGVVLVGGPLVVNANANQTVKEQNPQGPPGIKAKGAYLLDSGAGEEMWGKGADTKREMASTTKVMTAAVVVSSGVDLDKQVTVKQEYRDYVEENGASQADLKTGDKLTVRQLLYGALLPSGADAAYALADTVGTGATMKARVDSFTSKMNDKAEQLGMTNSKFDSFDGISKGQTYSTPRDMAKLGKYVLGSKNISKIMASKNTRQEAPNGRVYTWENTNRLLGSYKGVIGIKTGTGSKAGPCLIFAAEDNGRTVVGTIFNSSDRYPDATKMLDWGLDKEAQSDVKLRKLPKSAERD